MSVAWEAARLAAAACFILPACGIFAAERDRGPGRVRAWVDFSCIAAVGFGLWVAP